MSYLEKMRENLQEKAFYERIDRLKKQLDAAEESMNKTQSEMDSYVLLIEKLTKEFGDKK